MRVLLSTWGSRGDVEPLAGLAVKLRQLGVDAQVCAPPDDEFVALLARANVPMIPLGPSVQSVVSRPKPPTAQDAFKLAPELVAARFETLTRAAADGCDAMLATGLMPAGVRDVAERLGIPYVLACFHILGLPSQHTSPGKRPGTPPATGPTDRRAEWAQDAERVNALYAEALNTHRAAIGLPPVGNVRDHVFTEHPWVAADPVLLPAAGQTELDIVQTGAWILPDERPLPADLERFLDAGEPPVYVGFGSMASYAPQDIARAAIEASRAHGRRVLLARGWAGLSTIDDAADCFVVGEVNQQALFPRVATVIHHGGAGTTGTAARAGAAQLIVPLIADQPFWAKRVTELSIGTSAPDPTTESLATALATTLSPTTQSKARSLGPTLQTNGTEVAANLLLQTINS
ncbi:glycosyltransferase [Kribbella solani]|uniref:Vancomycin aglycone glucosyltransferase n=1 Tax=Kribbella solani TaxID=236067 RepID=A0A841E0J0_9ACTN|nr:glycosyltransferase [Kribbella solani]MBB5980938.1 vancomycin aglycone glucosyltransferase [Kribbella solani]